MRDLRRIISVVVIGSFSVAALLGIVALLGPGEFGETQARIVVTTVIVGLESLAVLCYLALAGHRLAWVGVVGAVISLLCAGTALSLTWVDWETFDGQPWQLFSSTLVLALTLAQASLLIAVADRPALRPWLAGTLAAAGVVAAMVIGPIVNEAFPEGGGYWRLLGVLAILDVLGTIVLMAVGALGRRQSAPAPTVAPGPAVPVLDREVLERLVAEARERCTTPSALVIDALGALPAAESSDSAP